MTTNGLMGFEISYAQSSHGPDTDLVCLDCLPEHAASYKGDTWTPVFENAPDGPLHCGYCGKEL